jgi:hypothetical protein
MPGFAVHWGLNFNPMTTKSQPRAAGQAAHKAPLGTVRIMECDDMDTRELWDDSGAFCSIVADLAPFALSALSDSARLTAENARLTASHAALVAFAERVASWAINPEDMSLTVRAELIRQAVELAQANDCQPSP